MPDLSSHRLQYVQAVIDEVPDPQSDAVKRLVWPFKTEDHSVARRGGFFIDLVMAQPAGSPLLHPWPAVRDHPDLSCEDLDKESNGAERSLHGGRLEGVRQRPFDERRVFPTAASAR